MGRKRVVVILTWAGLAVLVLLALVVVAVPAYVAVTGRDMYIGTGSLFVRVHTLWADQRPQGAAEPLMLKPRPSANFQCPRREVYRTFDLTFQVMHCTP